MRPADRLAFGRLILGPIFAEFALNLWALLSNLEDKDHTALLFCARGGLRLRLIYDRFLAVSGLESPVKQSDLMVSRVVAVRVAIAQQCQSAYEQIGYEMGGASLRAVAEALGGAGVALGAGDGARWDEPYSRDGLMRLLDSPDGAGVRSRIGEQASLFREHLGVCLQGGTRAILCDTGLSGSTMRLLEDGMPELGWGCVLFARSNYKKLPIPHYPRTVGLSVQADRYSPFAKRSAILRYWHLVEATLEPELSSVSLLERGADGAVRSNLEVAGWESRVASRQGDIFAGILNYIDTLPPGRAAAQILTDVEPAYRQLRRAVIWPTPADVGLLDIDSRSLDFGRVGLMSGRACEPGLRNALKGSLWREGAVALAASHLRVPMLAGIESIYVARWALQSVRTRVGTP